MASNFYSSEKAAPDMSDTLLLHGMRTFIVVCICLFPIIHFPFFFLTWHDIHALYSFIEIKNLDYILRDAKYHGDAVAIQDETGKNYTTFREIVNFADDLSCALDELGVGEGSTVAIYAPNMLDYSIAMLGTLGVGATLLIIEVRIISLCVYYVFLQLIDFSYFCFGKYEHHM